MDLARLLVSQRTLRNPAQLPALVRAVLADLPLPPIRLSEDTDGAVQIEDGHHRALAYWLAGRTRLHWGEYTLEPRGRRRPRFGGLSDLFVRTCW
jgi:hypothetical protein